MKRLSMYAGDWRYDEMPTDEDPEQIWEKNRATGEDIINHARRRVPQLIEQTRQALASRGPTAAIGGEPPSGPADAPEPAQGAPRAAEAPHQRPRPRAVGLLWAPERPSERSARGACRRSVWSGRPASRFPRPRGALALAPLVHRASGLC